jgi:hypothetical protein
MMVVVVVVVEEVAAAVAAVVVVRLTRGSIPELSDTLIIAVTLYHLAGFMAVR